ncbi:MAG: hypothetical protein NDI91_01980 [Sulfuritalea sp.]|nr:hypothetical protein [Sulfuritalea sp.]
MRYYRTLVEVRGIPPGGIIELSDEDGAQLVKGGAVEKANADHLARKYGANGEVDPVLEDAIRQMRETAQRVTEKIAGLDARLATLTTERAKMRSGKLRKEDALALVREDIRRKGEKFKADMVSGVLNNPRSPYVWDTAKQQELNTYGHIGINFLGTPDVGGRVPQGALYFYFADQIEAGFTKLLDGIAFSDRAPSLEERRARCEAIEREMAELQAQRNTLAEQLASMNTR